jgi:hypothetical protein
MTGNYGEESNHILEIIRGHIDGVVLMDIPFMVECHE